MTWFNVKEIRVREHVKKDRPGSRPVVMIVYSLEGHKNCFDFLAFESDKPFAVEKAASRWLELRGEKPVPETTEEALSREGELEVPLRAMITRDGDWARVSEVQFAEDVEAAAADAEQAANLAEDRAFLDTFTDGAEADRGPKTAFDFSRFKGST